MRQSDDRLCGLDALRALAALLVAISHLDDLAGDESLVRRSWLAVDFFFMLSGFVMSRTYESRFGVEARPLLFLVMRFRRLWKPLAIGSCLGALHFFILGANLLEVLPVLGLAFLLIPVGGRFILNNPAWSIFFELFANLIHAALLHRLSTAWLAVVIAASIVTLLLHDPFVFGTGQEELFWWGIPRVMLSYTGGILLFRIYAQLPLPPLLTGIVLLPSGIILGTLLKSSWFDLAFVIVACPLCVLSGLRTRPDSLLAPLFRVLGSVSFPLYAIHYSIFRLAIDAGWGKGAALGMALVSAGLVTLALEARTKQRRPVERLGPVTVSA